MFISLFAFVPNSLRVGANFVDTGEMAAKLMMLTNSERRSAGLPALNESAALTRAAYAKAEDMLARGYFSHTSPGGQAFYRWVDSAGYEYSAVAENLAVNLNMVSAEQMVSSWLDSPGHRANLLSNAYVETGMGVSAGTYQGQPAVFAVQVFAAPKNKTAASAAAPTKKNASAVLPRNPSLASKQPVSEVVKNVSVLGESTSTLAVSPAPDSRAMHQGNLSTTSSPSRSSISLESEAPPHKSWFRKILDFLL